MADVDANGNPIVPDVTDTTQSATPAAIPKPEDTVQYWKDKFNGANGTAIKLQRERESLLGERETLRSTTADLESKLGAVQQTAAEQAAQLKKDLEAAQKEASAAKRVSDVRATVAKDYAELAKLYDEDDFKLFATKFTDDELKPYLDKQNAKFGKVKEDTTADRNLGSLPNPPPASERTPGAVDLQQATDNLEKALGQYGIRSPEYAKAREQHLAAVMASSSK